MAASPLHFVVWKEGKYFVSQCLNVDVSSFGETKGKAVQNLNEALELYFEDEHGLEHEVIEAPEIGTVSLDHV